MYHGYGHKLTDSNYSLVGYFLLVGFYTFEVCKNQQKEAECHCHSSWMDVAMTIIQPTHPSLGEPLDSLERSGKNIP